MRMLPPVSVPIPARNKITSSQPAVPPIHNTRDATEILIDIESQPGSARPDRCGLCEEERSGLTARQSLL